MRKLILMSLVFVIALSMNGLTWAQGQGQRGQALAGQAQARGGQRSTYRGKAMPPNTPGATFTVIPAADLQTIVAQTRGDTPARVVGGPGGNYGAYVLTYQPTAPQPNAPINGTYHTDTAEIYYVLNGTGTALLGGELENATENDPEGNVVKNVSGPSAGGVLKNYTAVRYVPGTLFIVPPGVPHLAGYDVLTKTDYLIIRIDPKKTINLK